MYPLNETMNFCPNCGSTVTTKSIDGAARRVCTDDACNYMHWNNPVPVVMALVEWQGNYVIARNARWPSGRFSVIAGYLEANESPDSAILREVKEELG